MLRVNNGVLVVPPFECAWLTGDGYTLRSGSGCLSFEAKGDTDVTVILKSTPGAKRLQPLLRQTPSHAPGLTGGGNALQVEQNYTIIFGSHRNSCLKIEKDGVTKCMVTGVACSRVSSKVFSKYWIDLNHGVLTIGHGEPGEGVCHQWRDTQEIPGIQHIGLSCWDRHVSYRSIQLQPPLDFTRLTAGQLACGRNPIVPSLFDATCSAIMAATTSANVCRTLSVSELLLPTTQKLYRYCLDYLARHFDTLVRQPHLAEQLRCISPAAMCDLVCQNTFSLDEAGIFTAVRDWAEWHLMHAAVTSTIECGSSDIEQQPSSGSRSQALGNASASSANEAVAVTATEISPRHLLHTCAAAVSGSGGGGDDDGDATLAPPSPLPLDDTRHAFTPTIVGFVTPSTGGGSTDLVKCGGATIVASSSPPLNTPILQPLSGPTLESSSSFADTTPLHQQHPHHQQCTSTAAVPFPPYDVPSHDDIGPTACHTPPSQPPLLSPDAADGTSPPHHLIAGGFHGAASPVGHRAEEVAAACRVLSLIRYPLLPIDKLHACLTDPLLRRLPGVLGLVHEALEVHRRETGAGLSLGGAGGGGSGGGGGERDKGPSTVGSTEQAGGGGSGGLPAAATASSSTVRSGSGLTSPVAERRLVKPLPSGGTAAVGVSDAAAAAAGSGSGGLVGTAGGAAAASHGPNGHSVTSVAGGGAAATATTGDSRWSVRYQRRCLPFAAELMYVCDGDSSGVLHFLGTQYGKQGWVNPLLSKRVDVRASSPTGRTTDPRAVVGRQFVRTNFAGPRYVNGAASSWWQVDLGEPHRLSISYYTLRHDGSSDFVRSWVLQGSHDLTTWVDLKRHTNDTTVKLPGQYASWPVIGPAAAVPYRAFRLLLTGPNASPNTGSRHNFCLSNLELYGFLHKGRDVDGGGGGGGVEAGVTVSAAAAGGEVELAVGGPGVPSGAGLGASGFSGALAA